MRVVRPELGDETSAEKRLAAEMLCMEHGARAFDKELAPLLAPHEPWPLVDLSGEGFLHYKPAVGVVYYVPGEGFSAAALAGRLEALLGAAGSSHLETRRAVASTLATVSRVCPRLPPRALVCASGGQEPPYLSTRAVFTWVFAPISAALELAKDGFRTLAEVNAAVASLLYDAGRLCRVPDGGSLRFPLRRELFCVGPELPGLDHPMSALVADPVRGGLFFAGRYEALGAWRGPPRGCGPPSEDAPGRPPRCLGCEAPVGGVAYALTSLRVPSCGLHAGAPCWYSHEYLPGAQLLRPGERVYLCVFCWESFEDPGCPCVHAAGNAAQVGLAMSQAEACAATPGYERISLLLKGTVRAIADVPGAYVWSGPGQGPSLVLAGDHLGPRPGFMYPAIARLGLPVLQTRLAELRL